LECLPVESEVDRPAQLRVVPKQRTRGVEREHAQRKPGFDEELRTIDPVLLLKAKRRVQKDWGDVVPPIGLASLDPLDHVPRRRRLEVDVKAVDMVRSAAAVEPIPPEHNPFARPVVDDVVGPSGGEWSPSLRVSRKGRRHGAEEGQPRQRREVGRRAREADDEGIPAGDDARSGASLPRQHVRGPANIAREHRSRDLIEGTSVRLMARAKALARTGLPSLKRKPLRRVNVNVLKSGAATMNASARRFRRPASPGYRFPTIALLVGSLEPLEREY
jgi:hypothetical protein